MNKSVTLKVGMLVGWLCLIGGCGGSSQQLIHVTGTVKLDGTPLPDVKIAYMNVDGGVSADLRSFEAVTDANGKYSIRNVLAAKYAVSVSEQLNAVPQVPGEAAPIVFAEPQTKFSRYQPGRSPLVVEVAPGMKEADLDLTGKP